jgi:hypothetical protein
VEFVEHFHCELFVSYPTVFEIDNGYFLVWFRCSVPLRAAAVSVGCGRWRRSQTVCCLKQTCVTVMLITKWQASSVFLQFYFFLVKYKHGIFLFCQGKLRQNFTRQGKYFIIIVIILLSMFLIVVYTFLLLYMYLIVVYASYCCLYILIVRPCILNVVYVFLLLSTYS